jgi:hypothetical protein
MPRAAKMSQRPRTITLLPEVQYRFTTVAAQSSMHFIGGLKDMVIGTVVFVAFVVATGAAIVKAFEWHQDVLYGPYLKPQD